MAPVQKNGAGGDATRLEVSVKVPPKEPKKKDKKKEEDLSEEDLALKQRLELYVERVQDSDTRLQKVALEGMRHEIQTATSSMTSVRKPLKFLRPHYGTLKSYFEIMEDSDLKRLLADILSVLALTMSAEGELESLRYRLLGSEGDISSWGHEYVRNLAGEIGQEYAMRQSEAPINDLMDLVKQIVKFYIKHNAEPEAMDLLFEVRKLHLLVEHVDNTNYKRACLYLTALAKFIPGPDELSRILDFTYAIYMKFEDYASALQMALSLDKKEFVQEILMYCNDLLQKKQICYIVARQGLHFMLGDDMLLDEKDRFDLQDVLNNAKLSEGYLNLARDIEVMELKSPDDVYKAHLVQDHASSATTVDSARENLAATLVNAFVNAGFSQDKILTVPSEASNGGSSENWLPKNESPGRFSAAASLGMIFLWDVDSGLTQIEKCFNSNDNDVIAGALLGVGIVNCHVKNHLGHALTLLGDCVYKEDPSLQIGAIMGLGITYANTQDETVRRKLTPLLGDTKTPLDVIAFTAISLGLVYVGSCDLKVADAIISSMVDRNVPELGQPLTRLLLLGVGLLYLGKQDLPDLRPKILRLPSKIRKDCYVTVFSCAYAGTGNVLKVQSLLRHISRHLHLGTTHIGPAVLGIALVAMAEELGRHMAIRLLEKLMQYGGLDEQRAVPLALGLLCISNPKAAIISLGLLGAGTNNARIAGMLRNLSSNYNKEPNLLFCVRIAQGLVHLGKGLLSLNPYHSDCSLLSLVALAGLVTVLHACLDMKAIILGKYHYVLYFLVLAMQPRMLMTVDEHLNPLHVPVRVGKAVDVVGLSGQPKAITGFQTHLTPVLLATGDRAELATEKYVPLSPILEGFVILKENSDYKEDH